MTLDKEQLKLAIRLNIKAAGKCAAMAGIGSGRDAHSHAQAAAVLLALLGKADNTTDEVLS